MCSLMGALSFAVGAAQSILSFQAQKEQYRQQQRQYAAQKAQYDAQLAAYEANKANAAASYQDQLNAEGVRNQQQQNEAVNKKLELYRESLRAKGTTLASSEGPGLSEELLLQDIERQRADYSDIVGYNLRNELYQSQRNMKGMWAQAMSRGQQGNPGVAPLAPSSPSSSGLYIGLAGAALGAYNNFHVTPHADIQTAVCIDTSLKTARQFALYGKFTLKPDRSLFQQCG